MGNIFFLCMPSKFLFDAGHDKFYIIEYLGFIVLL